MGQYSFNPGHFTWVQEQIHSLKELRGLLPKAAILIVQAVQLNLYKKIAYALLTLAVRICRSSIQLGNFNCRRGTFSCRAAACGDEVVGTEGVITPSALTLPLSSHPVIKFTMRTIDKCIKGNPATMTAWNPSSWTQPFFTIHNYQRWVRETAELN